MSFLIVNEIGQNLRRSGDADANLFSSGEPPVCRVGPTLRCCHLPRRSCLPGASSLPMTISRCLSGDEYLFVGGV